MTVTRKLAAILAADVAGYSRLMGTDEEGTLERLKAHRHELIDPKIAEYHGRIVKTTGDGMLVEFGSVVDAVRCAVDVQQSMSERNADVASDHRIEFRVGVNLGDIIIDGDDIHGDGVNIAARLEAIAEPGTVCISATGWEHARGKVPFGAEDLGEHQLKNIERPVRVFRIASGASATAIRKPLPLPDKPSIAVLPFLSMSGDPEQQYFSDGITEDIITELSRFHSLFVIARNSCFTYKGRAVEVRQVGRELGVRYVLEGSLRKARDRIRVTAQLVEAETGNHVWAERYDRDLADIFAVQDEIAEAVTIAIAPAIDQAEQRRAMRRPPDSLDAWAAYQRGLWHLSRTNLADNAAAAKLFQQAIDLDPNFSGGYMGLARTQDQAASDLQIVNLPSTLSSMETFARRAVALDDGNAEARHILSNVLKLRGDLAGALLEAERSLAMSPNLASAHAVRGMVLICSGRYSDGLAALATSARLDPRAVFAFRANYVTLGLYFSGDYEGAVEAATRAIHEFPEYLHPYRWLAASLGQLGRVEEAKRALTKAVSIVPGSFDMYVRSRVPWFRPQDYAHMLDGLRKAGWEG
jgi:adenylate cyclase